MIPSPCDSFLICRALLTRKSPIPCLLASRTRQHVSSKLFPSRAPSLRNITLRPHGPDHLGHQLHVGSPREPLRVTIIAYKGCLQSRLSLAICFAYKSSLKTLGACQKQPIHSKVCKSSEGGSSVQYKYGKCIRNDVLEQLLLISVLHPLLGCRPVS